jgi:hypothetical protein
MGELSGAVSRREALKLSAKVAGVAAFASPVVVGAFSAPALADHDNDECDPGTDSDAIVIDSATGTKWNINCQIETDNEPASSPLNSPYGRYNSQRSSFSSTIGTVSVTFGWPNTTDNFRTDQSWYTIEAPAGYECSARWALSLGGPNTTGQGCLAAKTFWSDPPPELAAGESPSLFNSAADARHLPYCTWSNVGSDKCNNQFLELVTLTCCFESA